MFDLVVESAFFGARKVVSFHLIVENKKWGLKGKKQRTSVKEEMGNRVMGCYILPNGYLHNG